MKTLLFNGCSFVAGDDLGWDYSIGEPNKNQEKWADHKEKRKQWNLSAKCAAELNTSVVDLSQDGNSNLNITLKTIDYIQKLSSKEKNNLHVCVGWTESFRFLHYIDSMKKFENITPQWLVQSKDGSWVNVKHNTMILESIGNYCTSIVEYKKDIDSFLSYISEFLLLENFLIANNVTYTFWRSMGDHISNTDQNFLNELIDINNISNSKSWINFNPVDLYCPVWINDSWRNIGEQISISCHPAEESVIKQKDRICQNIINQLL